jgi:hypothetical protein
VRRRSGLQGEAKIPYASRRARDEDRGDRLTEGLRPVLREMPFIRLFLTSILFVLIAISAFSMFGAINVLPNENGESPLLTMGLIALAISIVSATLALALGYLLVRSRRTES